MNCSWVGVGVLTCGKFFCSPRTTQSFTFIASNVVGLDGLVEEDWERVILIRREYFDIFCVDLLRILEYTSISYWEAWLVEAYRSTCHQFTFFNLSNIDQMSVVVSFFLVNLRPWASEPATLDMPLITSFKDPLSASSRNQLQHSVAPRSGFFNCHMTTFSIMTPMLGPCLTPNVWDISRPYVEVLDCWYLFSPCNENGNLR